MSRKGRRGNKRSYTPFLILGLVVATAVIGYYIFTSSTAGQGSSLDGTPASSTVLNYLSGVSLQTLSIVGSDTTGITPPTAISGPVLMLNNKPEVLYMGAEYCPYCGAERWAMIVALDKFGNFTGIQYMQSSSTDVYPNTPTFSFVKANYTSPYISFVSVEQLDRNENPLQTATSAQTSLLSQYDSGAAIPFIDFANQFKVTGAQYLPSVLAGANWTQIGSKLNDANSTYSSYIGGAAAQLIAAICKIDSDQPNTVCSNTFAQALAYVRPLPSGGSQLSLSDALLTVPPPSAAVTRPAPTRIANQV
jgi:hypothetical protein